MSCECVLVTPALAPKLVGRCAVLRSRDGKRNRSSAQAKASNFRCLAGTATALRCFANVSNEKNKEEFARILKHLGKVLRLQLDRAIEEPPPAEVMHQMITMVHTYQANEGVAELSKVSWDDLPQELRRLLDELARQEQKPTEL